jgi:hypothetical protein
MPRNNEPPRLGRGRAFHAALQREWRHDVKEPVTAEKGIRKPSGRKGRIDVFVDDGRGSVSVVELKDTNWDAMTLAAVTRNVGRQCRQVWSYIDSQLAEKRQVSPGIIFRKRPTDPERLTLIERLFNAQGIAVAWHNESLAACRKRHHWRGSRTSDRPRPRTKRGH